MTKDWRIYAEHIVAAIERVWDYRSRLKAGRADADIATDAILRLMETICEAASEKLPDAVKDRHSDIEWKEIKGMRIRLAHGYLSVDPAILETTIDRDLEPLYAAMKAELRDESSPASGRV